MNTAIYSKSGSSSGISFAIPANTVQRVVQQIIKYGRVKQPGMGISVFQDEVADSIGVSGVVILETHRNGGAAAAGLRGTYRAANGQIIWGDVIIGIENEAIKNYDDLYNTLEKYKIGQKVQVTVLRDKTATRFRVRLNEVGG
jgi:S1-C subfamily serine protease